MTQARKLFVILLCLFTLICRGEETYTFHHFSTTNGLLNNEVKSLYRDSYGFLWIGTVAGLNRYDGYSFKHYIHNAADPHSLADDDVVSISEDAEHNLWIIGRGAHSFYNREKERFENANARLSALGINAKEITQFHTDRTGNLWIICRRSIIKYDFGKRNRTFLSSPRSIIEATSHGSLVAVLFDNNTLGIFNVKSRKWNVQRLPVIAKQMNHLTADAEGNLWLFSDKTDLLLYREQGHWHSLSLSEEGHVGSNFVKDLKDDRQGHIWIATDHKGLFVFDKQSGQMTNITHNDKLPFSIKDNSLVSLWIDSDHTVYVGYMKAGLSFYNPLFQRFQNFTSSEFTNISAIIEDRNGNLWIGTDGYGLYYKAPRSNTILKHIDIPGNIVVSLHEDDKGRVWIGSYLNGLLCYDNGKITRYTKENSGLSDNSVYSIQSDRQGNLWVGTLWGFLQRLNPETGKFDSMFQESRDVTIAMSLSYDGGSELYAGMISGLARINIITGQYKMLYANNRGDMLFAQKFIQTVFKDSEGNLWLGHNQGVTIWHRHTDKLTYLTTANGLVDNVIRGIAEDDLGRVWIATSNGCSVVSYHRDFLGNQNPTIVNYTTQDGLLMDNLSRHSILNLRDGSMLIGSVDGYSIMSPKEMRRSQATAPAIRFTNMTVGGNTVLVDSLIMGRKILTSSLSSQREIHLTSRDRMIGLEFSSMNMLMPDKVKYEYRLKGIDDRWIQADGNKVMFTQLPPGKHELSVRCTDIYGRWSGRVASLRIVVDPPIWATWYAWVFYGLLIVVSILLYHRKLVRESRHKLEQQKLRMEQQHAIQLNEMKLRFFTNISHDLRTPLTLIITPLQVMVNEVKDASMHKRLKSIQKNAEQLLALVNQLLDFRKLDAGAETVKLQMGNFSSFVSIVAGSFSEYAIERNIKLEIDNEVGQIFCQFDRDKIRTIIINLMSNAFKYTPDGGSVIIRIFFDGNFVCVSIADTGIGISDTDKRHIFERFFQAKQATDKTGSGIGLHIVHEYIRLLRGNIKVADNVPKGSVFTFAIPFKKGATELAEIETNKYEEKSTDSDVKEVNVPEEKKCPTILIVDDNKDMVDFLADNLHADFNVLTASNGVEALVLMAAHDVSLVVSDVMMPEMDGMELCRRIKTDLRISHIPVILLTAKSAEESLVEGLELGADDYITKPFNFNVLRLRINKFIEWTKLSHRNFVQKLDVAPSEITITKLDEQFISKAIKIVEEHIADSEFSVVDLGKEVGLSRGHLYKKLMCITGKGPSEFIRVIRLKRAKQLLKQSQYQVSEIAYMVGYNSPRIFTRNFKAEFGVLPSDYAKDNDSVQ
jgi:signal transduction histidine kinase/ligand-binding sensor domain-containing protein/DNA-binding response OmpR family regulator